MPGGNADTVRRIYAEWSGGNLLAGTDLFAPETGHQRATGRSSGVEVEQPINSVWTFRDGKVVHLVFDPDRQAALGPV